MPEAVEWVEVCGVDDVPADAGICVLVEGAQIALFRVAGDAQIYAVQNRCPHWNEMVLWRGLTGEHDGEPRVVLDPEPEGLDMFIWLGPGLAAGLGIAWAVSTVVQWRKEPDDELPSQRGDAPLDPFEQQLLAQLDAEIEADKAGGST